MNVLQFYSNNTETAIEANYILPLDSKAAVCDFQADINGTIIQGKVKEKQQARQEYQAAVQRGDGAYLLEQEQPDIFQIFVGNVPPMTRVNIKITYVVELDVDDGDFVKFVLSTTVAPRYTPPPRVSTTTVTTTTIVPTYRYLPYHKPWWQCWCDCDCGFHWNRYYERLVERTHVHKTYTPHSSDTDVIRKVNAQARDVPYALSLYLQVHC